MLSQRQVLYIITGFILIFSLRILYVNTVEYVRIYDAIMTINVDIHNINVRYIDDSALVIITLFFNNPSELNVKVSGLIGHVMLNGVYLGLIKFYKSEMVIGANSYNVSVAGEIEVFKYKIGVLLSANKTGMWNWTIYGWILIEIHEEYLPISYEGVYLG